MTIPFTREVNRVLLLAEREAERFYHEYIGTEHLLLGLVQHGSGVAASVLSNLDVDQSKIREQVERIIQRGPPYERMVMYLLPRTPRATSVIELAIREARELGHKAVGPEHLLLGMLREEEGVAAQVLMNLGVQLEGARAEVLRELTMPAIDPSWITGTVRDLARTIAEEQSWEVMPILADALEEAGCTDAETLEHLRQGGSHGCVRRNGSGCWVIDRLLGTEAARIAKRRRSTKRWWQFWR